MRKVLIANRGEIAVRVVRACRDAGLASVAVYADQDLDALHVTMADEAYALGGSSPADSYLNVDKILKVAAGSGADAVHPGYVFLAENAGFARAVGDAGLTWIGPPPAAIDALGDKVAARRIASEVGAPMAPGTDGPVSGVADVETFVAQYGLPIAIKAAFGGGGRGLKVVRKADEITEAYESAVREGGGRVRPRRVLRGSADAWTGQSWHVEISSAWPTARATWSWCPPGTARCSAGTRSWSRKPRPRSCPPGSVTSSTPSSKAILGERHYYVGAGDLGEFPGRPGRHRVVPGGEHAWLQVEHPVSEEVTGIDLVREMFRIADGQPLDATPTRRAARPLDRVPGQRGGRASTAASLPAPGTITELNWTASTRVPGWTAGYAAGMTVPQAFDSLLAKIIITGASRAEQRCSGPAARWTSAWSAACPAGKLPFHRAVVRDPAFTGEPFQVHTRWIETEFSNTIEGRTAGHAGTEQAEAAPRGADHRRGRRQAAGGGAARRAGRRRALGPATAGPLRRPSRGRRTGEVTARARASGDELVSPMQGTITKIVAAEGEHVSAGDTVVVLEAMKMEQPLTADKDGTVTGLAVQVGQTVPAGGVICQLKD